MLLAVATACGRTPLDEGPPEPPADASTLDAALDANRGHKEAGVADSFVDTDQGTTPDSALDGSPSLDAAEGPDASADASTTDASVGDASDAGDASDGGKPYSSCDECNRGDQQCGGMLACSNDDAGLLQCALTSIRTCVVGDAGCAVWDQGLACRSDVPCCVPCRYEYLCVGGLGNPCEQDTDCALNACDAFAHVCSNNQCADRHQDGQESDVDCGGQYCNACLSGQRCQSNFDCQAGHLCGSSHVCE
jgi:hypothetical protein